MVHERGGLVHLHSHGNIAPVLGDLASIGIDIINPFDWEENPDLPGLVAEYGKKIIFCGGLVGNLYQYSLQKVESLMRRAAGLARFAERGFIFMGEAGIDSLSVEEWDEWRRISLMVRTEARHRWKRS